MTAQTYTFENPSTGATLTIEADVAPLAFIRAEALLSNPSGWDFNGTPIDEWQERLVDRRQMFAPA